MNNDEENIAVVAALNETLYQQGVNEDIRYTYSTDGDNAKITLMGVNVWDTYNVETYDEFDDEIPVLDVVKRETFALIEHLKKISLDEVTV